jgi:hypothetical protein
MAKPAKQIPVRPAALVRRINRVLSEQGEMLRAHRGRPRTDPVFFLVNLEHKFLVEDGLDLEEFGRRIELLQPWEKLVDD